MPLANSSLRLPTQPKGGCIDTRVLPSGPWPYTDDTEMALSIYEILKECDSIGQDKLAHSFTEKYDIRRGYGPNMHHLLERIRNGESWQTASPSLFDGQGSMGNGAAMRAAPIGGYFADDLETVVVKRDFQQKLRTVIPKPSPGRLPSLLRQRLRGNATTLRQRKTTFWSVFYPMSLPVKYEKKYAMRAA